MAKTYRKVDPKGSIAVSAKFPKALHRQMEADRRKRKLTRSHWLVEAAKAAMSLHPAMKDYWDELEKRVDKAGAAQ